MQNIPVVNLGIVAVSRDCFPIELSRKRRQNVIAACKKMNVPVTEVETIVENERDVLKALEEIQKKGINALALYLGNFGPEGPTTLLAEKFGGPVMLVAAAEDTGKDLINGRGDAYCGLLSASYNIGLRRLNPYISENPVADPDDTASSESEILRSFRSDRVHSIS
jgi:L-fucose isomerase-like protein